MKTRFNDDRADAAVAFIETRLKHAKGRWSGSPFILDDWQRDDIVRPLFGTERWSPELDRWVRRYRKAYIEVPKKNGKSELGAALALQGVFADKEPGAEVFSLAADKKQAGLIFNVAADMVQDSKALRDRATVARSKVAHHGVLYVKKTRSSYAVLPGDAATVDGINPSRAVLDELHRQPSRHLYDLLDESFSARDEPLYVILTTAGIEDPTGIAYQVSRYARQVLAGVVQDPYFFAFVRGVNKEDVQGDAWKDEALWAHANPALTGFNPAMIDDLRRSAIEADGSPLKIAAFKRLRLNVWLPAAAGASDALVNISYWDRSAGMKPDPEPHSPCYLGIDSAASDDIAAIAGIHPVTDCKEPQCATRTEPCYLLTARLFVPSSVVQEDSATWARDLKESLQQWAAEGWLEFEDGDTIDDATIISAVRDYARDYSVQSIGKDPWQSKQLGVSLLDEGFSVYDRLQSMGSMSNGTDKFVALVKEGRVHHGGNPVLRWMISNAVGRTDMDGRIKPDKRKSVGKIDGIVAAIMALAEALDDEMTVTPAVGWL